MKWVTREKAKVDRIACPWLIKNFIDDEAEFIFVPEDISTNPESAGLRMIADGFRLISKDDHENMQKQFAVYDALYAYFKQEGTK